MEVNESGEHLASAVAKRFKPPNGHQAAPASSTSDSDYTLVAALDLNGYDTVTDGKEHSVLLGAF